jgi:DNA-binding IclR family transcriptional regulator
MEPRPDRLSHAMPNAPAPGAAEAGTVKSLAKGLKALDMLLNAVDVGTTEVAKALAVDKGGASRILKTLVESGFAVQGAGRRYRAGPKLRSRASSPGLPGGASIRERARPLLQRIYEATRETAHLAVRADDQVLYLDKLDTDQPLRVERPVGTLSPLHCTALGKILLAFAEVPLPRNLPSFTSRTPVSEDQLKATLLRVVEHGYATDDEEFAPGIRCVAAPLRDSANHVVAAIGLSGPTTRIGRAQLDELGALVASVAREFTP